MKELVVQLLKKSLKKNKVSLSEQEIEKLIELPPKPEMGDFAFPCFSLAKHMKKSPNEIALQLRADISDLSEFESVETQGAYINFFVNRKAFALEIIKKILKEKEDFGKSNIGKGKTVVIDMSSPNIAKPFGIGHLRSTIIGNSLSKIAEMNSYKTVKINYLGDWGTQFGKLIVGLKKFGKESELKKEPINYMLKLYVKANSENYDEEARAWFRKLETGDKEAVRLWKLFRELSLKEFNKIYSLFGIKFDWISGESFYNKKMDLTIKELKSKKLLKESDGALIVDLNEFGLGVSLIRKSDGATLYATRDLTAAIDRYEKYKFNLMIYEVGQEQKLHFQQVFKILELMGYKWAKNCIHVYHGLYLDKDGKKFATRKGKTIFMGDILNETISLAKKTIMKKNPELKNKEKVAEKVAIAAVFYGDLKNLRTNDIIFDIKKFLEFEGNTGPYLLYTYARASSILRKAKKKQGIAESGKLEEKEIALIKKLSLFPETVADACKNYNPSLIANYSYHLAQSFNEFYHASQVIGAENEFFRVSLVSAFRQVLKNSLNLLGIETIEEM